ncbi:hypothetical protein C1645_810897 [Glomus cerebriforme]|uniref:Uncharacterized protein n=1 Tax=Glomus cerebriforme TaxID=658196 RepID=A0A397S3Q6_9GLOM|nr:hypothetical protein C1645_810897 [Glomus cerebriforme]
MSSQGAISSLVFSSGAVVTAASMGYVFGRPTKSKKRRNSIQLPHLSMSNNNNSNNNISLPPSSTTTSITLINSSPKSPLNRFKLFRSKSKRSKVSSTYILPPKTVHPLAVHPDQLADDDISSICSDITSVFTMNERDRKTLSVPNLPATLQQTQQICDNSPSMSLTSGVYVPHSVTEITEILEEDEEEENWDAQSDSGYNEPLSKSAGKSSTTLPLSNPTPTTPPKRHSRCKSLPPINVRDLGPSLYHRQPTPSEIWDEDEDFDLEDTNELNVPSSVEESQVSLRMDISNIRDFVSQIGELKELRGEREKLRSKVHSSKITRRWTNGFLHTTSKRAKYLENIFKQDWEEADVIIDIADVAQDNEATFRGGKRVEVDIERIPSERHLKIFKRIVFEGLGEDAKDLELFDDDKENHYDYNIPSKNTAKKQKLMSFCVKKNDDDSDDDIFSSREKRRRKEDFRISVEVMPSLIEHLKKLKIRLNIHIKELGKLAHNTI